MVGNELSALPGDPVGCERTNGSCVLEEQPVRISHGEVLWWLKFTPDEAHFMHLGPAASDWVGCTCQAARRTRSCLSTTRSRTLKHLLCALRRSTLHSSTLFVVRSLLQYRIPFYLTDYIRSVSRHTTSTKQTCQTDLSEAASATFQLRQNLQSLLLRQSSDRMR